MVDGSRSHCGDAGSRFEACRLTGKFCVPYCFCCAPGPRPGRTLFLCVKRRKGRLEVTAKLRAMAASHRLRQAGRRAMTLLQHLSARWHGRKWSHEAKNGDAGCQKGRIDTQSRTHRSKNNTMCSHGTFLHFQIDFIWFCEWCSAAKNSPRRPRFGIQAAIRVV